MARSAIAESPVFNPATLNPAGHRLEMAPLETIPPARAACAARAPYEGPALVLFEGGVVIICLEDWQDYPGFAPRAFAPTPAELAR